MYRACVALAVLGNIVLLGCSSGSSACNASTCASGCCDSTGTCVESTHVFACGTGGQTCRVCAGGQTCTFGSCLNGGGQGGGSGGDGGSGGGGGGNPVSSCAGSLQLCQGACVDTQADENNCGLCGVGCTSGQVCDRGECRLLPMDCAASGGCPAGFGCSPTTRRCEPGCQVASDCPSQGICVANQCTCPAQQHACGQQCVSNNSPASCGTSCLSCPAPANGVATCNGTQCGVICNAGTIACGDTCVPCVAPANGTASCGSQNTCQLQCNNGFNLCGGACAACPTQNATSFTCSGNACQAATCAAGSRLCNGQCAPCPAGAMTTACQANACVASACPVGMNLCGGSCKADNDVTACGPDCLACPAGSGMTAICSKNLCDTRCSSGTTCKGRCGPACSWNHASTGAVASFADVFVDPQGVVHAASVYEMHPRYHRLSAGTLSTEVVSIYDICFARNGVDDTAPFLIADPAAGRPRVACARGNIMDGYRWNASGSTWDWSSIVSSNIINSYVQAPAQSNGVGAFAFYLPQSGTARTDVALLQAEAGGWKTPLLEQVPSNYKPSDISLLRTTPGDEWVAYRQQQIVNLSLVDAGHVTIAQRDGGGFSLTTAPWLNTDGFGRERDGTLFGVTRHLVVERLVSDWWEYALQIAKPVGTVNSLQVLVDPAGIVRVAYADDSGVHLASLIGGQWLLEQVTSSQCYGVRVAVNAAGKVAVLCIDTAVHVYD